MQQRIANLIANQPLRIETGACNFLLILGTGAASLTTLTVASDSAELATLTTEVKRGLKLRYVDGFTHIVVTADQNAQFSYLVGNSDADINLADGAKTQTTITNTASNPVPVSFVGEVEIKNDTGNSLPVTGNVGATISNFPPLQKITGNVGATISNFPPLQNITGNVGATISNFPPLQNVTGNVGATISNFPALQQINGTVSITNFPAQNVTATPATPVAKTNTANQLNVTNSTLAPVFAFNPARQQWIVRNVTDTNVLIGLGGAGLNSTNAVKVLKQGDVWFESDPLIAAQAVYAMVLPDKANGGYPNGASGVINTEQIS